MLMMPFFDGCYADSRATEFRRVEGIYLPNLQVSRSRRRFHILFLQWTY